MGILFSKLSALFEGFQNEQMKILMLGLDAAGKTTVLYKLKLNETVSTIPTIGFNVETVTPKPGITFTMWDVGGQGTLRPLWRYHFQNSQGLIYVIDSNDRERFQDSRKELNSILEAPEMTGVPVVVLANKQDLPNAAGCSQVAEVLHLPKLTDRKWHVQATCAQNGEGIYEAMDILSKFAREFKKKQTYHT